MGIYLKLKLKLINDRIMMIDAMTASSLQIFQDEHNVSFIKDTKIKEKLSVFSIMNHCVTPMVGCILFISTN